MVISLICTVTNKRSLFCGILSNIHVLEFISHKNYYVFEEMSQGFANFKEDRMQLVTMMEPEAIIDKLNEIGTRVYS